MRPAIFQVTRICIASFILLHVALSVSFAQNIPSTADTGRILNNQSYEQSDFNDGISISQPSDNLIDIPDGAEKIIFKLNSVSIEGMTVFNADDFESLYIDEIGQDVPATLIWRLAQAITEKYKENGYFLSRAYVPAQKVGTGDIRISVIEGSIIEVDINDERGDEQIIRTIINDILHHKPTSIQRLESELLRLGDLYNIDFDAVLSKHPNGDDGDVLLRLVEKESPSPQATLSINNYGSKFVGPYRGNIVYEDSFFDYHKTALSASLALPTQGELALAGVNHFIQISPSVELDFLLSKTQSRPGFNLRQSEIDSESFAWGFGAQWTPVRQRDKNLRLFLRLESLDTDTDTFGAALTRDNIRVARLGGSYNFRDHFLGLNTIVLTVSQGLSILGASDEGDLNLSRADASPDFSKVEASFTRQQFLANDFLLGLNVVAQLSSRSLFSSEEFGYGGVNAGRAYDFSEITGDHGLSALLDLQYTGFDPVKGYQINPYLFYDIGKVWNKGTAAIQNVSGSSAGFGTRVYGDNGLGFDATLAFPLTKSIDNPLYGNGSGPVLRFGLTKQFDIDTQAYEIKQSLPVKGNELRQCRNRADDLQKIFDSCLKK